MSLLQLPPEIVIRIFEFVGSSYFREDLSRLTVSQQWNKFAQPACYGDLNVTQRTLKRLLRSPHVASSLDVIKKSVRVLHLRLTGFEDWDGDLHAIDAASPISWRSNSALQLREMWSEGLGGDLHELATTIRQSPRLRVLRIQATTEMHPRDNLPRREYLAPSTLCDLLSVSNLTVLDLDLCGSPSRSRGDQVLGQEFHICSSIAKHLTTLQRLRLRVRRLCPDALKPQENSSNLRLNEVLVNLSLAGESPGITAATHASPCSLMGGLVSTLEEQAKLLVAQMEAPRIVRILTHTLPSFKMHALDILTGKTLVLNEGADWDDDGEAMKDESSDEESEIPDLSSDDDE